MDEPTDQRRLPDSLARRGSRLGLQLEITTQLRDQELKETVGPSYWEGAIDIAGQRGGNPMHGVGYLEMTGYAPNSPSQF